MIRICILLVSLSSLAFIYTDEDLPSSYETLNNTNYAYPNVELFEEIDNLQSFTRQSVLSEGTIYQIPIPRTGIYRLDFNYLSSTLGVADFNANRISIYGLSLIHI